MPSKAKIFLIVKDGARFSYLLLMLLFYSVATCKGGKLGICRGSFNGVNL